jgi:hypothetical protein
MKWNNIASLSIVIIFYRDLPMAVPINKCPMAPLSCRGFVKEKPRLKQDNANRRIPVTHEYPPGDLNQGPL